MVEITTLVIQIPSNTVTKKQNQTLKVRVNCTYQGPAQQVLFYAVVTQDTVYSDFDEIGSTRKSVYVNLGEELTPSSFYFDIDGLPLSGVAPKTSAYGVKVKAQGTFGTLEAGNKSCLYVQASNGAATLTASYSNGISYYSFTGFQPNATVTIQVVGGGYLTEQADSAGSGSGSFVNGDPAGTYTLRATDSSGHSATATFTIGG